MELPDSCEGPQLNGARPRFVVNNRLGLTPVSARNLRHRIARGGLPNEADVRLESRGAVECGEGDGIHFLTAASFSERCFLLPL